MVKMTYKIELITQYIETNCLECVYNNGHCFILDDIFCKVQLYKKLKRDLEQYIKLKKYEKIRKLVYNTIEHFELILPNNHIKEILSKYNYFDGFYEILKIIDD